MGKKSRSSETSDDKPRGFSISKKKIGKPVLVTITFQLTEEQETHLYAVAKQEETTRSEFCKQAVNHCLNEMELPFPEPEDVDRDAVLQRREQRKEWAASRGK